MTKAHSEDPVGPQILNNPDRTDMRLIFAYIHTHACRHVCRLAAILLPAQAFRKIREFRILITYTGLLFRKPLFRKHVIWCVYIHIHIVVTQLKFLSSNTVQALLLPTSTYQPPKCSELSLLSTLEVDREAVACGR